MPPIPQKSDFPSTLTLSITPPPAAPSTPRSSNILLLLHGLGDTLDPFTSFATALHLPETTCITLQAPHPLPFDMPGFHWGDDIQFQPENLDPDPGFARATAMVVSVVIGDVLVGKLGYRIRQIMVLGYGQGASVALSVGMEVRRKFDGQEGELGGIIALGGVVPLSAVRESAAGGGGATAGAKSRTPVLLVGGEGRESEVHEAGVQRTKGEFKFVEVVKWRGRRGDGMPRNREEMLPIMQFFARRLRSRSGVPEGSVEIS
ncbi:hypothetical protein AJ80_03842 [Polytolypa hystricis UAMH7299]|uniref:Phospholipase/carboxylesterase/thioesterase domain-containing protein n=1 Tax=Polytolypa hystricis (strain UAMH7299) TaxID=1447883 RepID=A0A2B7YGF6_POLH7|nr:hypothetical protein AJ80_03842 [Polytolypa hystricis UAMH7299]